MAIAFQRCLWVLPALFLLTAVTARPALAQNWPPEPKNLEFFPKDIEPRALIQEMRGFAVGLGVRCQHCHVGEEGQPIFTFDFASDEKETKQKARAMLEMVRAINDDHLAKIPEGSAGRLRVECVTCHRGIPRPEQLKDLLVAAGAEGGEAAVALYRKLRDEHLGAGAYDFSERTLLGAAEALAGRELPAAAIALVNESLVHTPNSVRALGTLAALEQRRGDSVAAIAALERALALDPENPHLLKRRAELTEPPEPVGEPEAGAEPEPEPEPEDGEP